MRLSSEFARLLTSADEIAKKASDNYVTVERLLLTLALATNTNAGRALAAAGVKPKTSTVPSMKCAAAIRPIVPTPNRVMRRLRNMRVI